MSFNLEMNPKHYLSHVVDHLNSVLFLHSVLIFLSLSRKLKSLTWSELKFKLDFTCGYIVAVFSI